ncbi:hypothetical protein [Desulfocicer vacuolatum]|nr:hypothetical protein [Desulfocicer vacuolatum]
MGEQNSINRPGLEDKNTTDENGTVNHEQKSAVTGDGLGRIFTCFGLLTLSNSMLRSPKHLHY